MPKKEIAQTRVTAYLPEDQARKLRAKLALEGKTVSQWFRELVRKFLTKES
jgi:hypothetical protein